MLVQDRNDMLEYFLKGGKPHGLLEDYRENRNSESWRVSRQVEELMEFILYLEDQLETFKYDIRT